MASDPRHNNDSEPPSVPADGWIALPGQGQRRSVWRTPLADALEKWFEKDFDELPKSVQRRVKRKHPILAAIWFDITPYRRRSMAQQHDIENCRGLARERDALDKKSQEIFECEQIGSGIPLENRTMSDIKSQEKEQRKLHAEYAVLVAALQQKAKSLGLGWPDDWGDVCAGRGVGRPNAKRTSIALFHARRASEEPLPKRQIQEAQAIREQWLSRDPNKAGPRKPTATTISGHISSVWREANKSSDKR
jgi:hypothetical protein